MPPTASSPPSGILVVDKPSGPSSHAVVSAARKALGLRKIGHAGTLDPAASGVLVLGVGSGTRLLGHLAGDDKEYLSTFVLGIGTVTDDAQGDVTGAPGARIDETALRDAMLKWTGEVMQRPSAVSAIKVDGRRAYDLVRSGDDVDLPPRPVRISAFELDRLEWAMSGDVPVTLASVRVVGSSGTYVRALARDVAADLGTLGHVRDLRRTRSGAYDEGEAVALEAMARDRIIALAEAARRSMPWIEVPATSEHSIAHGVQIPWPEGHEGSGPTALISGDRLLAVAQCQSGRAAYSAVFAPRG